MQVNGATVPPAGGLVPLRDVLAGLPGKAGNTPVHRPDEAALRPLRQAYNDRSLSQATRNTLVKDYFHRSMRPSMLVPATLTFFDKGDMPISRHGGVDGPLVKELTTSPDLQRAVQVAGDELKQQRPIEASWQTLVGRLGPEKTLKALTLIYSFYKWQDNTHVPAGVMDSARNAYLATCWINQQRSEDLRKGNEAAKQATYLPQTMVMNHGSSDTYDNPTHFFAHAWVAYRMRQMGFSETQALSTSAFAGAYYEAERPESLAENHGNAAIKDILMNAQGSDFGIRLFRDARTPLPGAGDGIAPEDRDI